MGGKAAPMSLLPPSSSRSQLPAHALATSVDSLAVHGGRLRGGRLGRQSLDLVPSPIACTSTYAFGSTAELVDHLEGRTEREEYGRYGNPTVKSAERAIAALEGASACALFASGMAAISTTLLAALKAGDHVVLTSDGYRRTRQLVTGTLARFGVSSTLVDPSDLAAIEAAIVPGKTRLLVAELPTNPYLRVLDLPAVAAIAHRVRGVKVAVDATFATPIHLRPLEHGADLVLHSATKYLAGHNDVLAGAVAGDEGLVSAIRDARGVLGAVLDPHAAYLVERGLKTLALRVPRQSATALRVARALEAHPAIRQVFYPGLPSHPDHEVASRLLRGGAGGVVTFRVRGDLDATSRFIDACRLATIAPSLGGVETLIEQPAIMSFHGLAPEDRRAIGIHDDLVRLAVGVEDPEDILGDLLGALAVVPSADGAKEVA